MPPIKNDQILFIINPHSGNGRGVRITKAIEKADQQLSYVITKDVKELKAVFEERVPHFQVIVMVGGDGSVHEVVKYLRAYPDKLLAVYPNGSGNGFAYELGFTRNFNKLMESIHNGEYYALDLIKIEDTFSINTLGVGFDSYVAHSFSKSPRRGLKSYIKITLRSFFTFKPFKATIYFADREVTGIFQMISIANTRQFGNNAIIAPEANPKDGLIDLVLVKHFPFYLYPLFAFELFTGLLHKSKYIETLQTDQPFAVDSEYKTFHVDGEPKTFKNKVHISLDAQKIKVIRVC